jgi:hypothetical protein
MAVRSGLPTHERAEKSSPLRQFLPGG